VTIRAATLDDLEAMRRVCLLTGDSGRDATGRWSNDGLLPDVYLEPYLRFPHAVAWVVDEGSEVVGYLVGVVDTAEFALWWREIWVPEFVGRHAEAADHVEEAWLFEAGTCPELMLRLVAITGYPAHLHVDLLPQAQGRGLGRELLRTLGAELVRRDVPGVHLGVGEANLAAAAFYRRLGFDSRAPGIMSSPSSRLVTS